jgi:chromosome segregation ATPase
MKEELRKLDSMDAQLRYMVSNKIETLDDLHADLSTTEAELAKQENIRRKLQNKIRRATPEKKEEYRAEKAKVTEAITELRKRRKMAMAIEDRSTRIDTAMENLAANEDRAQHRAQQRTRPNMERSYER